MHDKSAKFTEHDLFTNFRQSGKTEMLHTYWKHYMDSEIIGSCNCLTKTPEPKYHKYNCKYRLIMESNILPKKKMKYFLEINARNKGIESYHAADEFFRMYSKFLDFKLIDATVEEVGISRCLLMGDSDLDLTRENGIHSYVSTSPFKADGLRYTDFIQVDVFPALEAASTELSYQKSKLEYTPITDVTRRYILNPYQRVVDRSGVEDRDVLKVLNGDLSKFYESAPTS